MPTELEEVLAVIKRQSQARQKRVRDAMKKEQTAVDLRVAAILREVAPDLYDAYAAQARTNMIAETEARSARARASKGVQSARVTSTASRPSAAPDPTALTRVDARTKPPAPSAPEASASEQTPKGPVRLEVSPWGKAPVSDSPDPFAPGVVPLEPETAPVDESHDAFDAARANQGTDYIPFDPGFRL